MPGITWWLVFSNHTATFFYTPLHIAPIVGLLAGLLLDSGLRALEGHHLSKVLKIGVFSIIAGFLWSPALLTAKYLKDYPNSLDPSTGWPFLPFSSDVTKQNIEELIQVSEFVKEKTSYGDMVVIPYEFKGKEDFLQYYSDRQMDYPGGNTAAHLTLFLEELRRYRTQGAKKYKIFNPNLKLFALADMNENSKMDAFLLARCKVQAKFSERWILFDLDSLQ